MTHVLSILKSLPQGHHMWTQLLCSEQVLLPGGTLLFQLYSLVKHSYKVWLIILLSCRGCMITRCLGYSLIVTTLYTTLLYYSTSIVLAHSKNSYSILLYNLFCFLSLFNSFPFLLPFLYLFSYGYLSIKGV